MARGRVIRADFSSDECEPSEMVLHIAVPDDVVRAGEVVVLDSVVTKAMVREFEELAAGEVPNGEAAQEAVSLWAQGWLNIFDEAVSS